MNETWVVVETNYEHGEYSLKIFTDESSLRCFIIDSLSKYNIKSSEYDEKDDILYLIDLVEKIGNNRVDEQEGWGVREIRHINS